MGTVLVVDDDEGIRDFVATVLSGEGYRVHEARDGAEALTLVDQERPAVILLDMRMPILDGWRFAATYRERHDHEVPLVCMTAATDAAQRAAEIAAEATLAKPFDLEELLDLVGRYCAAG